MSREGVGRQSVDPTGGALFYHTRGVRPRWARIGQAARRSVSTSYADVPEPGVRDTPALIDVTQFLAQALPGNDRRRRRNAVASRAGRMNGVIQYAPAGSAARRGAAERIQRGR